MAAITNQVFQQLMEKLRLSNLNFLVSETPYSAQIMIRKRFLKDTDCPEPGFQDISNEAFKENIKILKEENFALRNELNVPKLANEREKETTVLLEDKVAKAESAASKSFEKNSSEVSALKKVNSTLIRI